MTKRLNPDDMIAEVERKLTAKYWNMSFTLDSWFFPSDLCPHSLAFKYRCKKLYELGLLERQGDGRARWGYRYHIPMKARLRERYAYARSLGFSPAEAKIMSGWSKEHIARIPLPLNNPFPQYNRIKKGK